MSKEVLNDPSRINPFQFANDICFDKRDIDKDTVNRFYEPWMVNRILSLYKDTCIIANELNVSKIPAEEKYAQYKFFLHTISKKKRFAKWVKRNVSDDIEIICNYYKCSVREASSYLKLLSLEQLNEMQKQMRTGGRGGR